MVFHQTTPLRQVMQNDFETIIKSTLTRRCQLAGHFARKSPESTPSNPQAALGHQGAGIGDRASCQRGLAQVAPCILVNALAAFALHFDTFLDLIRLWMLTVA